jgi:hypothetical protein
LRRLAVESEVKYAVDYVIRGEWVLGKYLSDSIDEAKRQITLCGSKAINRIVKITTTREVVEEGKDG